MTIENKDDAARWLLIFFCAPFIFIGMGIMIYGMFQVVDRLNYASRCSTETTGRVVDFRITGGRNSSRCPILVFTTADGQEINFTSKIKGYEPVGTTEAIRYNPAKPQEAERTVVIGSLYKPPLVLTMFGLIFAGVALWNLKRNLKK